MNTIHRAQEKWDHSDMVALAALAPFAADFVPWTAYSMRPAAIVSIVNEIGFKRRTSVVEIGAGVSTVFLACAVARNEGQVVTIEHDPEFGNYVSRVIAANGMESVARVEIVPLKHLPGDLLAASPDWVLPERWYDVEHVRKVCPPQIDTLVVDGPPDYGQDRALIRDPAVAVLAGNLASSYSLFLDDVDRPADRETARRWEEQLGITLRVIERLSFAAGTSDSGIILTL